MAQSILIFDFGTNEDAAQQARLKVDAWQQGFRLGKKILLKFDRKESNGSSKTPAEEPAEAPAAKSKPAKKVPAASAKTPAEKNEKAEKDEKAAKAAKAAAGSGVRILIRLDFSGHEKLTLQRWLDRIPSEEPFKSAAEGETIRHGDAAFAATSELFDSLD
jgi:hypothetical protein